MTLNVSQAFIFAAGRGERMRNLTDFTPKPLLRVCGKPIIDYTIEKLDKINSIKRIIINGFYLSDQLADHIKNLNNPKIVFSKEVEKIETGGGLLYAKSKFDMNLPLLTVNGDLIWQDPDNNSDISKLCDAWNEKDCDILLGLKKTQEYIGYDGKKNGGGDFNLIDEKLYCLPSERMTHAYVGLQIINPKILENADKKCFSMSYFYKSAIDEKSGLLRRVKGIELDGCYFHVGDPDSLIKTERILSKKSL